MMKQIRQATLFSLLILLAALPAAQAEDTIATLRGAPIVGEPEAPAMAKVLNKDPRRARNYPEQPPTFPHKIDRYQIDFNSNKCMT